VDSVCWIAILNADDEIHVQSDKEYKTLMKSGFRFVTSTAVLNEVANALSKSKYRNSIVEFQKGYSNLNAWKSYSWMSFCGHPAGIFMKNVRTKKEV
jgi:predicted nucleic acid-binding protein